MRKSLVWAASLMCGGIVLLGLPGAAVFEAMMALTGRDINTDIQADAAWPIAIYISLLWPLAIPVATLLVRRKFAASPRTLRWCVFALCLVAWALALSLGFYHMGRKG